MADIKALRSYLVSLGFAVNTSQAAQFSNAIKQAASVVDVASGNIAVNLVKMGAAAVAAIEGMAIAFGAMAEKAARADQEYRLFGERMFMSTQNAKGLKIALDTLGVTLEQAAFDPEIHRRVMALYDFQRGTLNPMMGGDFRATMIQIRDAMM